jgi:putative ubiquitin-RnfH superfamily antitoxin RatB of RatAB toxin-antitoxin module
MVKIELVYVSLNQSAVHIQLDLCEGSSVSDALTESKIYELYPETRVCAVGIFSKVVSLDTLLRDGDRIELYRSLVIDPKEKRRQLARNKK